MLQILGLAAGGGRAGPARARAEDRELQRPVRDQRAIRRGAPTERCMTDPSE